MRIGIPLFYIVAACLLINGCVATDTDPMETLEHASVLSEPRPVAAFQLSRSTTVEYSHNGKNNSRGSWTITVRRFHHTVRISVPVRWRLLADVQLSDRGAFHLISCASVFVSIDPETRTTSREPGRISGLFSILNGLH